MKMSGGDRLDNAGKVCRACLSTSVRVPCSPDPRLARRAPHRRDLDRDVAAAGTGFTVVGKQVVITANPSSPDRPLQISGFARSAPAVIARVVHQLERLDRDLHDGRWAERHGGLLAPDALDLGYRLVVAAGPR